MKLDEQLRKLQQMPEDDLQKERIKRKIFESDSNKKTIVPKWWKELIVGVAICAIALFLMVVPQLQHQATNNEIQHIYTYTSGVEGRFKAKPSTLYTGMQEKTSVNTIEFFENLDEYPILEKSWLGEFIVDVIVVREKEKHRYQLSSTRIYDVETGVFYDVKDNRRYEQAFDELSEQKVGLLYLFVPLAVITINSLGQIFYSRRKIPQPIKVPGMMKYFISAMIILAAIFAYGIWFGAIWKPLLILLAFGYGALVWNHMTKVIINPYVLKIEHWKLIGTMVALLYFIWVQ